MQAWRHLWVGLALLVGMIGLPSVVAEPTEKRSTTPGPDIEFFGVIEEGETDKSGEWTGHGDLCLFAPHPLVNFKTWDFVLRVLDGSPTDVLTLRPANGFASSVPEDVDERTESDLPHHPTRDVVRTAVTATTTVPGNIEAIQHEVDDDCVAFSVHGTQVADEASYVVEVDGPPGLPG